MPEGFSNQLLLIDSDAVQAERFRLTLSHAGYNVDVATESSEGLSLCNEKTYDVVIVEYKMPGLDGLEIVRRLAIMGPIPATVMLTAYGNEAVAVEAMKLGASDYLIKDPDFRHLEIFPAILQRIRQNRLLIEAKRLVEDSQQAIIEGLRSVVTVADQLIGIPDMDTLFRRTIELAQTRLGVERCRLFIVNENATRIQGTYGVDKQGAVVNESAFSATLSLEWERRIKPSRRLGDFQWQLGHGASQEWAGAAYETFGESWFVNTPIQSQKGSTGVFVNDAAISDLPLDDIKQEIIVVFCSVLGSIIERKRAEAALLTANEELEQRVEERTRELVQINQERQQLSRRLLEVQETERRTIARELHDEIGQAMTAVKMNLQAIARVSASTPQLEDAMSISERALQQVRDLSLNLRPSMLDDLGLAPALRWYLDRQCQRSGLKGHFAADEISSTLAPEIASTCFRVTQEALTNVIRHARAENVFIELRIGEGELILIIRDDGVGFDVKKAKNLASQGASLGVLGMQERVHLINGDISIDSVPPLGTEVWVRIPMVQETDDVVANTLETP